MEYFIMPSIVFLIILILSAYSYRKRKQKKLDDAFKCGGNMGKEIAASVDAYLSKRFEQFEEFFFKVYEERLSSIVESGDYTKEDIQNELISIINEIKLIVDKLPHEIQDNFPDPFEKAKIMDIEQTLLQFVDQSIDKYSLLTIEKALDITVNYAPKVADN